MVEQSFPRGRVRVEKEGKHSHKKRGAAVESKRNDVLFAGPTSNSSTQQRKKVKREETNPTSAPLVIPKSISMLPVGGGACVHKKGRTPWIEPLSFNKLNQGMKLLACCRQVQEDVAIFSLPNLWTAYMLRKSEKEPPLDTLLVEEQFLAVKIVKAVQEHTKQGMRRRIEVTCTPEHMNPTDVNVEQLIVRGRVKSIEHHGLLVDLGVGRKGFLAFSEIQGSYSTTKDDDNDNETPHHVLCKNRILDFVVKSTTAAGVLQLKLPSSLARISLPSSHKPTLADLQPGTLLESVVLERSMKNGLAVTFCGNAFRGSIELMHLGAHWIPTTREESTGWKTFFEKNPAFKARILAVDPRSKIVRLTLLPHLLALRPPQMDMLPQTGEVVEDCTVLRLDVGLGALLAFPDPCFDNEEEGGKSIHALASQEKEYKDATQVRTVYVHISKTSDDSNTEDGKVTESAFSKQFAPSTKHTVRIINTTNVVEGVPSGATAPTIVNAHIMAYTDLVPGKLFKAVPILKQMDGGSLLVDFGMGIQGLVPKDHLFDQTATSDFRNKIWKVKYSVGAKIDVRVLSTDPEKKRCVLTAKKTLVKAKDEEIVSQYQEAKVGQRAVGFVSSVSDKSLSISLFGSVFGRVSSKSLAADLGIEDHKESYKRGDAVTCTVLGVRKRPKQSSPQDFMDVDEEDVDGIEYHYEILLSLRTDAEVNNNPPLQTAKVSIPLGTITPTKSLRVVQLVPHRVKGPSVVPGYAIVGIKSKYVVGEFDPVAMPEYIECKLPYDQLLDIYEANHLQDLKLLDGLAKECLTVGKKINRRGLVLTDPKKSNSEFASAVGHLAVVSLKPQLIESATGAQLNGTELNTETPLLPGPESHFYPGALVRGYIARIDPRHGAFVRFLGGMTGLVPKSKGGLLVRLFSTVDVKVIAVDDKPCPPKLVLGLMAVPENDEEGNVDEDLESAPYQVGDMIKEAIVEEVDFYRARLCPLDEVRSANKSIELSLHCVMAKAKTKPKKPKKGNNERTITSCHPFFGVEVGDKLSLLKVRRVIRKSGNWRIEVGNIEDFTEVLPANPGVSRSGVVTSVSAARGIRVLLDESTQGHIPPLEISNKLDVLNNLSTHYPVGSRINGVVVDLSSSKNAHGDRSQSSVHLSLMAPEGQAQSVKPKRGDLILGRVNQRAKGGDSVGLMLDLRGGLMGRCDITELCELNDWSTFPLNNDEERAENDDEQMGQGSRKAARRFNFLHGTFLQCRVMGAATKKNNSFQVSIRRSRVDGDIDEDQPPEVGATAPAFVTWTDKRGCFVRLSRQVEGRVILKELCDAFLPNPAASFRPGRLVAGKVKAVRESSKSHPTRFEVDMDMRESVLGSGNRRVSYEDIEIGSRFKGSITRVEDYGVFVQIENSDVSGLVHKSECSDDFVRNVSELYSPGDLVKVFVSKKLPEKRQIAFSMKSSHFQNDAGSSDASVVDGDPEPMDVDSDDENFVQRLSSATRKASSSESEEDSSSGSGSDSDDSSSSSEVADDDGPATATPVNLLDTNVGFDWSGASIAKSVGTDGKDADSASSDEDESDNEGADSNSGTRSRKRQAERRKEEKEIARREAALADGTADDNPETVGDFERLLASQPNSSELWMRFMAFHLSLADVNAARDVANRAFDRIEFRLEQEKLNVWCALLAVELKFGNEQTLQLALNRASQNNNPKHVQLRMCEMLENEAASAQSSDLLAKANELYAKSCKRFRGKKKVWVAYMEFMLKNKRQDEALALSKQAMLSLKPHKHVETMSKFAQLMFQYGSTEKARTLFDGLIRSNRKRLDLFFVYVDKEIKHGEISAARSLFERVTNLQDDTLQMKLSEKRMKQLFKKWFSFEEQHGSEETQRRVKEAAEIFINQL